MIKELRIGNWIIQHDGNIPFWTKVWKIEEDSINGKISAHPIPLTPEILIEAGFDQDETEFQHPHNTDFDLMISVSENGLWCAYNFGHANYGPFPEHGTLPAVALPICNPFKYVHQLQNLYFALTGKELEINLTEGTN